MKYQIHQSKRIFSFGFTLVELIVVITILAILGTLGFISFQGFSRDARDSKRLSDIATIEKTLSLFEVRNDKYPLPDNSVTITASGAIINYQGTIENGVLSKIGQAGEILDPLLDEPYTYSVSANRKEYQILSYMEEDSSELSKFHLVNSANALEYSDFFLQSHGDSVGIMIDQSTNQPINTIASIKDTGNLELTTIVATFDTHFESGKITTNDGQDLITKYSLERPEMVSIDPSLILYYDLNDVDPKTGIIPDKSSYKNDGTFGGNIDFSSKTHAEDNTNPRSAYISSGVAMNFANSDYTMLAMSYYDSLRPSTHFSIFTHGAGSQEIMLIGKNRSLLNYRSNGGAWVRGGRKTRYPDDEWVHVAFTVGKDGDTQMFYNGVGGGIVNTGSFPDKKIFFNAMSYGTAGKYSTDKIDEIRLYNRKLSEEEINAIYNSIKLDSENN